jgi:dihydrofolate reductase
MKITLAMVASADGRTTKGNTPGSAFASPQDQQHFSELIHTHTLIIMGRTTYEAANYHMKHTPGRMRIVMTRHPEKFDHEKVPGMLEFTSETPGQLIKRLSRDYENALLVSGAELNGLFFKEKLVDELILTLEPKLFGKGNGIIGFEESDIDLKLVSVEKMNPQGTLLLTYQVIK